MVEQKWNRQKFAIELFLLTGLILITAAIATFYISNEKFFYYWDFANYSSRTSALVESFRSSPPQAIQTFFKSLSDDYSLLPCLLLIPFIFIFGDSRIVYIVSSTLVYIVPFSLIMGMLATKIISVYSHLVFWSTAFLTLLIPPTWISTLRGYPDIGAAVLIGLAILIYLKDIQLKFWWQTPLIGVLLALAILFRRHFAYSTRAFFVALILQGLTSFFVEIQNPKKAFKNLCRYNIFVILTTIASAVTLIIFAPTFVKNLISTDYRTLYSSYEKNLIESFQFYGKAYGWIIWVLAFSGFFVGILNRVLVRKHSFFIIIFGGLSLIQWGLFSRQLGVHYANHFTIFVVLGIASLFWTVWSIFQEKKSLLILLFGFLILSANAIIAMTPIQISNNLISFLFATKYPPLVRKDYDNFIYLIQELREIASDKQATYIAASSLVLNDSLVITAEKQLYEKENKKLNILDTPDIDSRDFYPIRELLQAQYVVVASPFQHHLPPKEQEIVKIVIDAFTENWEIAQDFKRLPQQFKLDKNVLVSIYQRTHPTSIKTALNTLEIMQERIKPKPGNESSWMIIDKNYKSTILLKQDKTVDLQTVFQANPVSFIYFGSISEVITIDGKNQTSKCVGFKEFSLNLKVLDREGITVNTKNLIYTAQDSIEFPLSIPNKEATYLLLEFKGNKKIAENSYCSVYIKDLTVTKSKERT